MVKITKELLRKRAEHNEGMLSTLEEVYLLTEKVYSDKASIASREYREIGEFGFLLQTFVNIVALE